MHECGFCAIVLFFTFSLRKTETGNGRQQAGTISLALLRRTARAFLSWSCLEGKNMAVGFSSIASGIKRRVFFAVVPARSRVENTAVDRSTEGSFL